MYWRKFQVNKMVWQMKRKNNKQGKSKKSENAEKMENTENVEALSVEKLNEDIVYFYVVSEKSKPACEESINDEYMQKVILYGYVMVILYGIILFWSNNQDFVFFFK